MRSILKISFSLVILICFILMGVYLNEQSGDQFLLNRIVDDEPLVCTLTDGELADRKELILEQFKTALLETKEIKNGYAFKFEGGNPILDNLVDLIRAERKCCRFLTFDLNIQKEENPIWFKVTGPIGTKLFLKYELDLGDPNNT